MKINTAKIQGQIPFSFDAEKLSLLQSYKGIIQEYISLLHSDQNDHFSS